MVHSLFGIESTSRILDEEFANKILGCLPYIFPSTLMAEVWFCIFDVLHHSRLVAMEWRIASQQHPNNHTEAPHVCFGCIAIAAQDIWTDILGRPTRGAHGLGWIPYSCKAEINELQLRRLCIFVLLRSTKKA